MMKRLLSKILFVFIAFSVSAQSEYDALKFTQQLPSGSARFTAMGGAFGALGADLSVMATNPAGTGVYRQNDANISTTLASHKTESDFNGNESIAKKSSFQISNLGFVSVTDNEYANDWKRFNYGFAYNHLNDYNRTVYIDGKNFNSSLLDYQTNLLNNDMVSYEGNPYYDAEVVFYNADLNNYYSDYNFGGYYYGSNQQHRLNTKGNAGEYDLNFSTSYRDVLYLGATLGFQQITFSSNTEHAEQAFSDEIALVKFKSYDNLRAKGNGFNLKLGALLKITNEIRVGAAFHTPTSYNFRYNYWTDVYATLDYGDGYQETTGFSPNGSNNWEFTAPAKYILSSAVVLGGFAIISAEMEYMNYGRINMHAIDNSFVEENSTIKSIYGSSYNFKAGAEFKLSMFSFRAGAGFMESPYSTNQINSNANRYLVSGGLGINTGIVYFDASYQYITGNEYYYMYGFEESKTELSNQSQRFVATLGVRF